MVFNLYGNNIIIILFMFQCSTLTYIRILMLQYVNQLLVLLYIPRIQISPLFYLKCFRKNIPTFSKNRKLICTSIVHIFLHRSL